MWSNTSEDLGEAWRKISGGSGNKRLSGDLCRNRGCVEQWGGDSVFANWSNTLEEDPGGSLQVELTPGTWSLGVLAGGRALGPSSLRDQFSPTPPRCHSPPHPVLFFQSLTIDNSYLIVS